MDKYVIYSHVLSPSLCCITTDALMIREKVGISFARLIPEVRQSQRKLRERSKESAKKMKEGETTHHQVGICELMSG